MKYNKDVNVNKYVDRVNEALSAYKGQSFDVITLIIDRITKHHGKFGDYFKINPLFVRYNDMTLSLPSLALHSMVYKLNVKSLIVNSNIGNRIAKLIQHNRYITLTIDTSKAKYYNNNKYYDITLATLKDGNINETNLDLPKYPTSIKDYEYHFSDAYYDEITGKLNINEERYYYD